MVGQSVTLRCTVFDRLVHLSNLSVLFKYEDQLKSEKCLAYMQDKYTVTCETVSNSSSDAKQTFLFRIHSVEWTDKGNWSCILSGYTDSIELDVIGKYLPHKWFF